MDIQTIVSDLDDTLLNPEGELSPATVEALRQAMEMGVNVVLASGRSSASMRRFVEAIRSPMPYIAYNGGTITNAATHEPVSQLLFSPEEAREFAAFAHEKGVYAQTFHEGSFYFSKGDTGLDTAYTKATGLPGVLVENLHEKWAQPTPKVLLIAEVERVAALLEEGRERFAGRANFTISKPYFLEITPPGATKGEALQRLAQFTDIRPETTMAFGDSVNDLSMICWAGHGVAMGNARPEVKAAARHTCLGNDEDGVARMICRHVLCKEEHP